MMMMMMITASILQHCIACDFPKFTFTLQSASCICSWKGAVFFLWPWTLTRDLDLQIWPRCVQVEPSCQISKSEFISFITFCARHGRGAMYSDHGHVCVCLSLAAFSHYCTDLIIRPRYNLGEW